MSEGECGEVPWRRVLIWVGLRDVGREGGRHLGGSSEQGSTEVTEREKERKKN